MDFRSPDQTSNSSEGMDYGPDEGFTSLLGSQQQDFLDVTVGNSLENFSTQPVEMINDGLFYTVEMAIKKYDEKLLQSLEGISGCLSQLELHCYSFEQSLGEIQADLVHEHGETNKKLRLLEKHLQEVDSSIQILTDKQELVNTQEELARLQLVKKQYAAINCSRQNGFAAASTFKPKACEARPDAPKQQLTLAMPSQATLPIAAHQKYLANNELLVQQAAHSSQPTQQIIHVQDQPNIHQLLENQLLNQTLHAQGKNHKDQCAHAVLQHAHQIPQIQNLPTQATLPPQHHVNQCSHPYPQCHHRWIQQSLHQQPQQSQLQPSIQPSIQPPNGSQMLQRYPSYIPQPVHPN